MYSSIGIDEIKDNKAPYLEKERLMSLLKVRNIPPEVVKSFNLSKKLTKIVDMFNKKTYRITAKNTRMAPGGMIPNHFFIIEDWTKGENDSWRTFLVYNYLF
jgi:hypothetical protein